MLYPVQQNSCAKDTGVSSWCYRVYSFGAAPPLRHRLMSSAEQALADASGQRLSLVAVTCKGAPPTSSCACRSRSRGRPSCSDPRLSLRRPCRRSLRRQRRRPPHRSRPDDLRLLSGLLCNPCSPPRVTGYVRMLGSCDESLSLHLCWRQRASRQRLRSPAAFSRRRPLGQADAPLWQSDGRARRRPTRAQPRPGHVLASNGRSKALCLQASRRPV
jgi:hypothetical protein